MFFAMILLPYRGSVKFKQTEEFQLVSNQFQRLANCRILGWVCRGLQGMRSSCESRGKTKQDDASLYDRPYPGDMRGVNVVYEPFPVLK